MNNTLWWIATHLDSYHFNTDEARRLKREIQEWTTLPAGDQIDTGEDLLRRFSLMFANNPWLEQSKLVTDQRFEENKALALGSGQLMRYPCRGDITGACADAYFVNGNHYTLKPPVMDANAGDVIFMDPAVMKGFLNTMKQSAEVGKHTFAGVAGTAIKELDTRFAYILDKKTSAGSSPSLLNALSCLLYLYTVYMTVWVTWSFKDVRSGISIFPGLWFLENLKTKTILIGLSVILILLLLLMGRSLLNTVVKGFYRTGYTMYIKRMKKKYRALTDQVQRMSSQNFFSELEQAMTDARNTYCTDANAVKNADPTRKLLSNVCDETLLGDLTRAKAPWSRYRSKGEKALGFFLTRTIICFWILYIVTNL